jgi:ATP-binding cassette subfamily B protein
VNANPCARLEPHAWPLAGLGRAIALAAARAGARGGPDAGAPPPETAGDRTRLARWLVDHAERCGLDARETPAAHRELDVTLRRALPALALFESASGTRALLLLSARGRRVRALTPDGERTLDLGTIRAALCSEWEPELRDALGRMLEPLALADRTRGRVAEALLAEQLHAVVIGGIWSLRLAAGQPALALARARGLRGPLALLLLGQAAQVVFWMLAWLALGRAALGGVLSPRAIAPWALLLAARIPARLLVTWAEGALALRAGGLLRERLLLGALRLRPEEMRRFGAGAHLGSVIESEALELAGTAGGVAAALALVELAGAGWTLAHGVAGALLPTVLAGWLALLAAAGVALVRARAGWTTSRLALTHALVEQLAGHETRLAQLGAREWSAGDARALAEYEDLSRRHDRAEALWNVLGERGWMVAGTLALAAAALAGATAVTLAVSLGGLLLARQAIARLTGGAELLFSAALSWRAVGPLARVAARPEIFGDARPVPAGTPVLEAIDLTHGPAGAREPVLRTCGLVVAPGERILLSGESGSGKSTLVSLVSGLAEPDHGRLLAAGATLRERGRDGWRQCVATAPQFHENHVFAGSLAFNVLMGRQWPPAAGEIERAEALCRELGLGGLLERMPGGMHQAVGESGWQLSHGERNRVFLARALAQEGGLLVLDESFGALDPETLAQVVLRVLEHPGAVIVAGHF